MRDRDASQATPIRYPCRGAAPVPRPTYAAAYAQLPALLLGPDDLGSGDLATDRGAGVARASVERERQRARGDRGAPDRAGSGARGMDRFGRRHRRQAQVAGGDAGHAGRAGAGARDPGSHGRRAAVDGVGPGAVSGHDPGVRHADAPGVRVRACPGPVVATSDRDQLDGGLGRTHDRPRGRRSDNRAVRGRGVLSAQRRVVPRPAGRAAGDGRDEAVPARSARRADSRGGTGRLELRETTAATCWSRC